MLHVQCPMYSAMLQKFHKWKTPSGAGQQIWKFQAYQNGWSVQPINWMNQETSLTGSSSPDSGSEPTTYRQEAVAVKEWLVFAAIMYLPLTYPNPNPNPSLSLKWSSYLTFYNSVKSQFHQMSQN